MTKGITTFRFAALKERNGAGKSKGSMKEEWELHFQICYMQPKRLSKKGEGEHKR
jgi:hypothetical protein